MDTIDVKKNQDDKLSDTTEENKSLENIVIEFINASGSEFYVMCLVVLVLILVAIDLWYCVSTSQLKNESYYLYETSQQHK